MPNDNGKKIILGNYVLHSELDADPFIPTRIIEAAEVHLKSKGYCPTRACINPCFLDEDMTVLFKGTWIKVSGDKRMHPRITYIGVGRGDIKRMEEDG